MADAVHFATWDDQADPTKASGFNGFPAPFCALTSGPATFPAIVPYTQIIEWFWRIIGWQIAAANITAGASSVGTGAMAGSGVTRELELVQQISLPFSSALGASLTLFDTFGPQTPPVIALDAGNFYPSIQIRGSRSDGANNIQFDSISANLPAVVGSFNATVAGIIVPVFYNGAGTFAASQLDFTPNGYWPYAAASGSPIYNTTTGVQLQDPQN